MVLRQQTRLGHASKNQQILKQAARNKLVDSNRKALRQPKQRGPTSNKAALKSAQALGNNWQ